MHLATMPTISNSLGQRTAFQRNRPVSLLLLPIIADGHFQGELEHRRVKKFYKRTNKVRFERQIAKHERMERHYRKYLIAMRKKSGVQTSCHRSSSDATENVPPQQHYSVAKRDRDHVDLYAFSGRHVGDPALKVSDIVICMSHPAHIPPGLCCKTQGPPSGPHSQQTV